MLTRFACIACEVLYREVSLCVARSANTIDVTFITQGLHDVGHERMVARLQAEVDKLNPESYAAVLLAYGLCNNGLVDLTAREVPIVVPRAHDCITLFLGSKQAYREYFDAHPGTYFQTTGWMERDKTTLEDVGSRERFREMGMKMSFEEYVEKYGRDNAEYIISILGNGTKNYSRFGYIALPELGPIDERFREEARQRSADKGWEFDVLPGSTRLIDDLFAGNWNEEDFLVVPPGQSIAAAWDESIVKVVSGEGAGR